MKPLTAAVLLTLAFASILAGMSFECDRRERVGASERDVVGDAIRSETAMENSR